MIFTRSLAVGLLLTLTFAGGKALAADYENVSLQVDGRIHFNTNVSDFEASRAFYGKLGFETLGGFPDANTQAMARAMGIETPTEYDGSQGGEAGGYLLHGELISVGGFWGGVIDLIEFTIPRNDEAPYEKLNRLGVVKAAMLTTNIDADYAYMTSLGVEFLAAPLVRADGKRFAVFRDPDGTFYELIELDEPDPGTETTHIVRLGPVGINVSDLEHSIAWYGMLGYQVVSRLPPGESLEVSRALGFAEPVTMKRALLRHRVDASELELTEWVSHFDPRPPYPVPINHLGINRLAFISRDIEADTAALKAQGVELMSPITPCCSGDDSSSSIVAFYDPDGAIMELADQPWFIQILLDVIRWFRNLF